jgi:putative aldouronate transport system permease protein
MIFKEETKIMITEVKKKRHWLIKELPFHAMLIPAVIITIIFRYIPFAGISIAFQQYNPIQGFFDQQWIGFDNFKYIFSMPGFSNILWNTLFIASMKIVGNLAVPLIFALLLNEVSCSLYKRSLQTAFYMPHFISWVALAGVILDILSPSSGIVNNVITALGFKPVFFIGSPQVFPYMLAVTDVWKEFGWGSIIYLAAIIGIDPTYYEAAIMDGAGRWKQVIHVTIPLVAPIVMLMTVLSIGNILQAGFDQVFNLYSPQVYSTGDIIDTFVYRLGIIDVQFGPATAVGLFKSVISFILIALGYRMADKVAGYRVF